MHDKTRDCNSETGNLLTNTYKLRKVKVQEAIKKKENALKLKQFHDKFVNSSNKVNGFWDLLKGKNKSTVPNQIMNPKNKSELFTDEKDINAVLSNHFNSFGRDSSLKLNMLNEVKDFLSSVEKNEVFPDSHISVKIDREQIGKIIRNLQSYKASGIDEIPNEFLKFGGDALVDSLVDLFTTITDLEAVPDDWQNGIIKRLLKAGNVSNKVLFGDCETDFFDQEFGLKQGCVLSPAIFSVLMNDLVSILEANNFGAELSSQLVNCLLFADDVVLIGKSEAELHRLLDITANFASNWNLKFNQNKSKVMIIGKRLDKDKKWQLGNLLLEEANEYKYLGVYFTRSLTFAYHM
ncbi:Hypothetical predicted protein [Mytilus galloprovincialis]|uniref:Reverse transcriptase domain-containing protein n=1 Tax=Mytilus galloprovincialis TaxID=29158 RepID=A0A8B6FI25_MYTGA|nr:Hypothetical predicted protein [Mytilus galloprovincialis]